MKLGRPTKYKRKYCQTATDLLSKGYSKEALAGEIGISRQCLYEWLTKYKEFGDTVQVGEAKAQHVWEELGMKAAQGQATNFNTLVWMFVMKNRFGWKERQDVTTNDSQITTIELISYADVFKRRTATDGPTKSVYEH